MTVGTYVGVWFGADLCGDNVPIKGVPKTNIQEDVMIHFDPGLPVTIGEGCGIGLHAIVHGSSFGAFYS